MSHRDAFRGEQFEAGAIYGTVVCLTVLVLLEEDRTDPADAAAILGGTAFVFWFWLAHAYAHLVPRIAAERAVSFIRSGRTTRFRTAPRRVDEVCRTAGNGRE
jgi:hypothetical protein